VYEAQLAQVPSIPPSKDVAKYLTETILSRIHVDSYKPSPCRKTKSNVLTKLINTEKLTTVQNATATKISTLKMMYFAQLTQNEVY